MPGLPLPFDKRRLALVVAPMLALLLLLLAVEWLTALRALPVVIPAPSAVWADAMKNPAVVTRHLLPTVLKAASGYAVAAVIALTAAAAASLVLVLRAPIYNLGVGMHSVPLIATTPLLALWLGTGPPTHVLVAALACYFPMLVGAMQGFQAVERSRRELFHMLSATPLQQLRYLVVPSAMPYLFAGFKVAAPSAVLGTITAEWAGAELGLGALMLYALGAFDINKVWLSVLLACGLSAAAYAFWAAAERLVIHWDSVTELRD
jgi:ABC-type nitrate/sulfonate/bicarbonate transport system permease component